MFDWLARWAVLAPRAVALEEVATGRTLTYAQLDGRSARLAVALREAHGVRAGDRVAMLASGRAEVFEALFACVKLGAIFVPLSWRLAQPELEVIIADCEPVACLYDDDWAELAAGLSGALGDARGIALGAPFAGGHARYENLLGEARAARSGGVALESVSTILYTSGTTGRPKGALLTNRQVLFNAVNTSLACDLTGADSCLAFLPLFHTGGLHCLATPVLHRGGRVLVMPGFDAERSVELLASGRVSTTIAVPTMVQMLAEAGLLERGAPAVRALLCGGAALPLPLLEAYHEAGLPLRQGYGLTEVGPNCFTLAPLVGPHRLGSVGLPAFHSEARLVGEGGAELGADEPGELWLRGPHVCAGYWRQPEATRAVLDDEGWFHTGDVLRRSEDGYYTVVGRQKDMFVSGGENVYPAEVENVLSGHPWVRAVAVVGVDDPRWGQVGLAVVVPSAAAPESVDFEVLRAWARERLAGYKVPRHWRALDALPLNASGKVVKTALAALVISGLRY